MRPTLLVIAATLAAAPLGAQTVSGRVVDSASRRPVTRLPVRLVPAADTARDTVYAATVTADDGVFLLVAPAPGRYRVRLGDSHLSAPLTLATADAEDQHEYALGAELTAPAPAHTAPPGDADRVYEEKEVTTRARMLAGGRGPEITPSMAARMSRGGSGATFHAAVECVVDVLGACEPATVRVVSMNDAEYGSHIRDFVAGARFSPARVGDRTVRQHVRLEMKSGVRVEVMRVGRP